MGSTTIPATFNEPHPLTLAVNGFGGGVTGLSPVVAIRDALTVDSFLDFADLTFKTAGHTTRQAALVEVGDGRYFLAGGADPFLWTPKPDVPAYFVAEYEVPGLAVGDDLIVVTAALSGEEFDTTLDEVGSDTLGWQEVQTSQSGREIRRLNLFDDTGARITISPDTFKTSGRLITRRELI
ncbi:MAG: hypothetical protein V3T08_09715 [Gemmatimonadota bacterium]